jgi:hypothetical protein
VEDRDLGAGLAADRVRSGVGRGTLARFLDEGLVYADGSRLRAVPFAAFPV